MSNIKFKNARLSYPSLFNHGTFNGDSTGKYECTFILDKKEHAKTITEIKEKAKALIKSELKGAKLGSDRICLKDGDEQEQDELKGCYAIKVSNKNRPLVIDRNGSPLTEEDNVIYAGCYVNGIIDLWAQNNGWGKRINGTLKGVQFYADGEAFGNDSTISTSEFDVFNDDDMDDLDF